MKKIDLQRSSTHLLDINVHQFLSFCDPHENIVTVFGSSNYCDQIAGMCKKNCKKHKTLLCKHKYLQIQNFLKMIKQIRKSYRQFHFQYIHEVIPSYIQKLKNVFKNIIEELLNINHNTLLLSQFFNEQPKKKIQDLLTQKMENWQAFQLKCSDIKSLEQAYLQTIRSNKMSYKMKIENKLDNLFLQKLKEQHILPQQVKKIYQNKPDRIQVIENIKQGKNKLQQIQNIYISDLAQQLPRFYLKISKLLQTNQTKIYHPDKSAIQNCEKIQIQPKSNFSGSESKIIQEFIIQIMTLADKSHQQHLFLSISNEELEKQKQFWTIFRDLLPQYHTKILSYIIISTNYQPQVSAIFKQLDHLLGEQTPKLHVCVESQKFIKKLI